MKQEKRIRQIRNIFTVIFTICAAGTSIYCSTIADRLGGFATESFALLMAGALCGDIPGIIAVLLVFQFKVVTDATSLYVVALYLVAVMLTSWAAKHRIFKSVAKSFFWGVFIAVIVGAVNGLVVIFTMNGAFTHDMSRNMIHSYTYSLSESVDSMLILYLLFRFLPAKIKACIPNAIYYIDENDPMYDTVAGDIGRSLRENISRLSFRITRVIILEAILLTISAAAFAIHLVSILQPDGMSMSVGAGTEAATETMGGAPPAYDPRPDGENPPPDPKPDGENPAPDPKPVGIFGQRLEDAVSKNGLFNDEMQFQLFGQSRNINSRTAVAFAFRLSMILFTIGVITAALADAYMQLTVARPIRKMSDAMKGFAFSEKDGSIGGTEELSDIKIHSKDEIEELYHALVKTVADTEEYLERLREEDKMKNELEVAKAASEAKSAFLSSMSHEIRTPINAVLGFDEMILLENKDPEINKYAQDIQSAGKTLLALINDILDFSKIEAGKMDIVPVQYELTSTVNDVVSMTMSLANDKGLTFDVNVDPKTPHLLFGDEIRIKQCMTNILSNAVKYTEKGGLTLTVGFEETDDPDGTDSILLTVAVRDTGIGIREEDMEKLFTAFDRLDQVRNKAVKGTGLGMSITKQLLENMGSRLEVESEYEKGSNFHFAVKQQVVKREEIGDLTEAFKKYIPHEGSENKNDTFFAPDADILVTDDTENNLLVVTRLLKRTGIKIDTAESGAKTLELIKKKKYDIIYLDHMMPEMDGIETLHRMKELPDNKNADTPVIVLTANAVSGSREMYMNEGFTDYMTKPVSYLTLKNSLVRYLPEDKIKEKQPGSTTDSNPADGSTEEAVSEALAAVQGIDVSEGIMYSGDEETLIEVIQGYSRRIDEASGEIENELKELNIKNYTVHVHALKSSSRLIGAKELSEMALDMENTGNEYQKAIADGDVDKAAESLSALEEQTPVLLGLYRSYKEKLAPVTSPDSTETKKDLPEMTEEELREILMGIKEFAEAFDMDSTDSAMKLIESHAVPPDKKELIDSLKKSVLNVDRDAILTLLENI
ncbi:MAG: response regulator [Lachnospiraceae bacterium]|nr:response regulator [Lachnospiraceae bacterium]